MVRVVNTAGTAQAGLQVYVFNDASYTGYHTTTDVNGQATFTLPIGGYHFRADLNGTEFWSDTANDCAVPGCAAVAITVTQALVVSVQDTNGAAQAGLPVFA